MRHKVIELPAAATMDGWETTLDEAAAGGWKIVGMAPTVTVGGRSGFRVVMARDGEASNGGVPRGRRPGEPGRRS